MESLKHRLKSRLGGFTVRVRQGPLRGMNWSAACGTRFIRGTYEVYKTEVLLRHLEEGNTVFDVGAHVGYFSAISSLAVGATGQVFAFEPRPLNYDYLLRHISANRLENVTPLQLGVASSGGARRFEVKTGTGTGRISPDGALNIVTVSLDAEVASGRLLAPDLIKIDVEGGEIEVLQGAQAVIAATRPKMLVATHGPESHSLVIDILENSGYAWEMFSSPSGAGDVEIMAVPR